jgi:polygalacturonase
MSVLGAPFVAAIACVALAGVAYPPRAAITTYADLPGHAPSTAFAGLTVGGASVAVRHYKGYSYARLAASGAAPVVVTAGEEVARCEVRPAAYAVRTTWRGRSCAFRLPASGQVEVSINSLEKLFVFVDPPASSAPLCCDGVKVFDATSYSGVDRTGGTKSTGLQAAMNDIGGRGSCTNASPCTLYFKRGTYLAKQLFLRSRVKLYLESGAKLRASTSPADYTLDPGTHRTAFITADNVSYTGIEGPGAIDGDGLAYRQKNSKNSRYPYWNCRTTTNAMCWDSPRLVLIRRSHHVTVRDVMMLDPAAWTNHVHYSNQVIYENVKVLDDKTKFNTDAMDVDASTNVTVRNSYYHGRDDGFCVKSTKELGLIRPSTGIRFLNNTVAWGNNATKLGTETYVGGNMDDILVQNLYVTNHHGRAFGVYVKDGNSVGPSAGIRVEGVFVDRGGKQGFAIEITKRKSSSPVGRVSRVSLKNFNLPSTTGRSAILGYDASHRVSDVSITDYRIGGALRKTLSEARIDKNAHTANITIR